MFEIYEVTGETINGNPLSNMVAVAGELDEARNIATRMKSRSQRVYQIVVDDEIIEEI